MRGDFVIVRALGNIPLIRRLWAEGDYCVYITNNEQFQLLNEGKGGIEPVGFPREDVFKYDPKLAPSMAKLHKNGKWDWNKLVSF